MKRREDPNRSIQSDIINGLHVQLYKGLVRSCEKDNKESFKEIFDFVLTLYLQALDNRSIAVLNQVSEIPKWIYVESIKNYPNFREKIIEKYSKSFASLIKIDLRFSSHQSSKKFDISIEEIEEIMFEKYLEFIQQVFFYKNRNDILLGLKIFKDLYQGESRTSYEKYHEVIETISILENQKDKLSAIESLDKENPSIVIFYRAMLALAYWTRFLYQSDQLSVEFTISVFDDIDILYDFPEDLIRDSIILIEQGHDGYFGINEWDYIDRTDSNVYSPPQARYWVLHGLILKLLKEKAFEVQINLIPNDRNYLFFYEDVQKYLAYVEQNFEKWKEIINCENLTVFKIERDRILLIFRELKRRYIYEREHEIASLPLSIQLITRFQDVIFNAWERSSRIIQIAEYFGNKIIVSKASDDFLRFGYPIFFLRAKTMFTEKEHNRIGGIQDIGAKLGRDFDSSFFDNVNLKRNRITYNTVLEALMMMIADLKNTGQSPTLIFLPNSFLNNEDLIRSSEYTPRWKVKDQELSLFNGGLFEGLPICAYRVENRPLNIVICNFAEAFQFELVENEELYKSKLNINVNEVSQQIAAKKFEEDPNRYLTDEDGNPRTVEEAIIYLQTAVNIDIWWKARIKIVDENKYAIGTVSESVPSVEQLQVEPG